MSHNDFALRLIDRFGDLFGELLADTVIADPVILMTYPAGRITVESCARLPVLTGMPSDQRAQFSKPTPEGFGRCVVALPPPDLIVFQFRIPRFLWVISFGTDARGRAMDRSMMLRCPASLEDQVIARDEAEFLRGNPGSKITNRAIFEVTRAQYDAFNPWDSSQHEELKMRFLGARA